MRLTTLACLLSLALAAAPETSTKRPDDDSQWQKAYPAAKPGQRRIVIHLEAKPDEDEWKVEVTVGKVMETDGVNQYGMSGDIHEVVVEGWGYTYLRVEPKDVFSTRMAPPTDQKPVRRFVGMVHPYRLFRYNSKLPVVVYVPEGYEVRYRLWKVDGQTRTGDEG